MPEIKVCSRSEDPAWESLCHWSEDILNRAAKALKLASSEVSLSLVSTSEIHQLNKAYLQKDRPTDVLAFPQDEHLEGIDILGDIVISPDIAELQAQEKKHTLHEEMSLLLVHGLLHLLGYDHAEADQEKEMFQLQNDVLRTLRPNKS